MPNRIHGQQVRALAECAGLELSDDRLDAGAELLGAWLPAANELSRKMAAREHDQLMPITVLTHPLTVEKGE